MSATLADAIVERLAAALPRPVLTGGGDPAIYKTQTVVGNLPPRYLVVMCDGGQRVAEAIDSVSSRKNHNIRVMSVAYLSDVVSSPEDICALLADDVGATLTDFVPQVDGYRYAQLVNVNVREPVPDESATNDFHIVYAISEFSTFGIRTT